LNDISRTFHGRDVFAPVAAHLSAGVSFEMLGEPIQDYQHGDIRTPQMCKDWIKGEIIYIDRFGNLVTNIPEDLLREGELNSIDIGGARMNRLSQSYSAARVGEPLAIFGSHGYLEIAVRNGSAAQSIGVTIGETITLRIEGRRE
jgi:S-adenosylmethionine hydrolase